VTAQLWPVRSSLSSNVQVSTALTGVLPTIGRAVTVLSADSDDLAPPRHLAESAGQMPSMPDAAIAAPQMATPTMGPVVIADVDSHRSHTSLRWSTSRKECWKRAACAPPGRDAGR
jgi:hypothetical protein